MFHKIKNIIVNDNFTLDVEFENGEIKHYDVKPLFNELKVFKSLENNIDLFKKVYVDTGGYGIVWNDNIDLSSEELYNNGQPKR